jgi:hypothetical protein
MHGACTSAHRQRRRIFAFLRRTAVVAHHSLFQGTPHRAAFKRVVAAVRAVELFPVRVGYLPALCDVVASVEPIDAGGSSGFRSRGLLLHGGVAMLLAAGACLLYLSDGSACWYWAPSRHATASIARDGF